MAITKAQIVVTPGLSVTGGTLVTLDGSSSTAADNTTLTGQEAFIWSQITGPVVALKPTSGREGTNPIDSVQFNAPSNRPNSQLSFRLRVKDSGGVNLNRNSNASDIVVINVTN
jgi:hypothetical protein